jgi:N-methylhydantoinase B
MTSRDLDGITLSVIEGTLASAVREMTLVLTRTARSPIIAISTDFSNAIFDATPEMAVQGQDQPVHLGSLIVATKAVADYFAGEIYPGDVMYHNDPATGGGHLVDMAMFKPVFYEDELVFWATNRIHASDVGGPSPGGWNPLAEELYDEGLRMPPIKLWERGQERRDIVNLILSNLRTKRQHRGDMGAQLGALGVAERRLLGMLRRYGKATVKAAVAELLDRAEQRMRAEIARMPEGVYEGQAVIEGYGPNHTNLALKSVVTVRGDELHIRLDSPPQVRGYVNSYAGNTISAVYQGVLTAIDPSVPHNGGLYRPLRLDLGPPGTVLNAVEPAACSAMTGTPFDDISELVQSAMSQIAPERAVAGWAHWCGNALSGRDPRYDEPYAFVSTMAGIGGAGAMWQTDGWSCCSPQCAGGGMRTGDVELVEYQLPIHIHQFEFAPDSAHPGQWRGGFGMQMEYEPLGHAATVAHIGEGTSVPPPSRLGGGGKQARVFRKLLLGADGAKEIPLHSFRTVQAGERVRSYSPGGGGIGDPYQRQVAAVLADVRNELVSVASACEEYGVVIDPASLQLDQAATHTLREVRGGQ